MPTYSGDAASLGGAEREDAAEDPSGMFRQGPDLSREEPVTEPVDLTEARAALAANPSASGERTLTRRELRAMQQAQQANQQAGHVDEAVPVNFEPAEEHEPSKAPESGPTAVTSSSPGAWPFAPLAPSAAPAPQAPRVAESAPVAERKPDDTNAPATNSDEEAGLERQPFTPPTGHWSTAAELDDKNQPFDQIIKRNVGQSGSATTTNALILPSLPVANATGPLTSTGEILVTGTIDLPRSVGSTGAHPDRIDSSDLDRLLDSDENEFNTSEVAPIRASRAISTHTSTRGVITPPKKRGGRLPIVLMITAGVLAVGVIGLLVAAYVMNVF
jgi:hypothetical protein